MLTLNILIIFDKVQMNLGIFVILKRKCLLIKMNWDIFILKIIIE